MAQNPNQTPPISRHSISNPTAKPRPLSFLADRCVTMRQLSQVHAQMILTSRIADNYAASRLLSFAALSLAPDLPLALALFRHTQSPNSFMYNTLIRALAASPNPSHAFKLYTHMQHLGPKPGKHTFPFVLKASAALGSLSASNQIHSHVIKHGFDTDPFVANGLIRCYTICAVLDDARKVFDELSGKNLIVWTTMISGYAQNFRSREALVLFEQMVGMGIEPSDATLASVLSACARSGGMDLGRQVHLFIEEKGIEVGVILGTALVDMYAKNGAIDIARELFGEMPERNIATWNAMICGLAHHGHGEGALVLFWELEKEEVVRPNDITLVGALSACCHAGLVGVGRRIFYRMEENYGIEPKLEHYGCMVDLLGRSGRLEEAEELVLGMKWGADVVVLGALLTACKNHRNIQIMERVGKEILKLEPDNHGVYVVLSNMYAEVGRWDDVLRLREVMKDGGLEKTPGWSCIDGDGS